MNPPPPMLPATGCTTARAKPVATAASTALPPCRITATPVLDASSWTLTTTAWRAWTGRSPPAQATRLIETRPHGATTAHVTSSFKNEDRKIFMGLSRGLRWQTGEYLTLEG